MWEPRMILDCLVAACTSAIAIVVLRRAALTLGLVDRPNQRKQHIGNVPLVGGLAIFIGLIAGAAGYGQFSTFDKILLDTSAVVALLGALDDRFNLSVRDRLLVQTIVILVVIASTGIYIHTLGFVFGHEVTFGWVGIPLTVIAVVGLLNAFNMMDGIDGLAGSLALVSIAAIFLFAEPTPLSGAVVLLALLASASLPYLAANLGFMGGRIFMGDSGSMVIGYLLAWTLIRLSQIPQTHLSPVDVLWCVALPVFDTLAVMYRRLRQGRSPFKPDRGHIHHILMDAGLGPRATLVTLVALAASIALAGALISKVADSAGSNLTTFCIVMSVYIVTVTRAWLSQEARQSAVSDRQETNNAGIIPPTAVHPAGQLIATERSPQFVERREKDRMRNSERSNAPE
jgi:UDP-GlcNAc:undecaprenyl-phosphate GlcNAc-1-phosphate transferase